MTQQEFLQEYKCIFTAQLQGRDYLITTTVIRRSNNAVVDRVKTVIDTYETNDWVLDSQSGRSVTPISWQDIIDKAKRFQLDYVVIRAEINNFYPINTDTNIDSMYI